MTNDRGSSGVTGVSIDPVCGKSVAEDGAESFDYKRRTYFFCSPACRRLFEHQAEGIHVDELAKMGALFEKKARWGIA
jgi:YHS domain-containing protein